MVPTLIRGAGIKDFKCTAAHRRREGNSRRPNSPVCPGCQPQPRVRIRIYVTPAWAKPPKRLRTLGLCLKSQTREVFPGSHLKPPAKSSIPPSRTSGTRGKYLSFLSFHKLDRCHKAFVPGRSDFLWVLALGPLLSLGWHQIMPLAPSLGLGYQVLIWLLQPLRTPGPGFLSCRGPICNSFHGSAEATYGDQCLMQ